MFKNHYEYENLKFNYYSSSKLFYDSLSYNNRNCRVVVEPIQIF